MKTPKTWKEIGPDWVGKLLKCDVDEKAFEVIPSIGEAMGFLSNMSKIKYRAKDSPELDVAEKSLIAKFLPDTEPYRSLMIEQRCDKHEIMFYKSLIPALLSMEQYLKSEPRLECHICKMLFGAFEDEGKEPYSILVFEDLKAAGYVDKPFCEDIEVFEREQIVCAIATFHALGYGLEDIHAEKKSLPAQFPGCFSVWYDPDANPNGFKGFFLEGLKFVIESEGTELSGVDMLKKAFEPLAAVSENVFENVLKASQKYATNIHGDLWQNNVMFHHKGNLPVKLIDWQMVGYVNPLLDLSILLVSFLSKDDLKREVVRDLCLIYFTRVRQCLEELGVSEDKFYVNFNDFLDDFASIGMAWCFIWYMMSASAICSEPKNKPKFCNILNFMFECEIFETLEKFGAYSGPA